MTGKKRSTDRDWAKIDAHVITAKEYEEIPELTDDDFARGTAMIGDRVVSEKEFSEAWRKNWKGKGGRPKSERPKQVINLRVDADVLESFRAGGPGWQTRMNAALRKAARLPVERAARNASRRPQRTS